MYCPSCGAHATNGLRYCKSCGYALSIEMPTGASEPRFHPLAITAMFLAVAAIAAIGIIGILVGSSEMVHRGLDSNRIIPLILFVTGFGSLTVISVVAILVRFLSNLLGLPGRQPRHSWQQKPAATEYPPAAQVPALPRVMPSVTEHTTRNFDPARREGSERKG
ncbi:MAG TPA: hypothetical protein VNO70_19685 [Blastocatellia bacterium]|nr:hypothetical protein [Blastocatellia bacterium]